MKKNSIVAGGVLIVLGVLFGSYAIFHKTSNMTATLTANSTNQNQTASISNAILTTKTSSSVGQYLAGSSGMALYTYGGDSNDVSNVRGSLLALWPAYIDTGSTTNLPAGVGTIKRTDDGKTQYTYNGKLLYYFVSDSNGQVTGNGVSGFMVATPMSAVSSAPTATTTSSAMSSTATTTTSLPMTSQSNSSWTSNAY